MRDPALVCGNHIMGTSPSIARSATIDRGTHGSAVSVRLSGGRNIGNHRSIHYIRVDSPDSHKRITNHSYFDLMLGRKISVREITSTAAESARYTHRRYSARGWFQHLNDRCSNVALVFFSDLRLDPLTGKRPTDEHDPPIRVKPHSGASISRAHYFNIDHIIHGT